MDTTILQIPVTKILRDKASVHAQDMGFSSLQEAVRIFLTKMAAKSIDIKYEEPILLSSKNARRYEKMIDDVESGKIKTKTFTDVDKLLQDLRK